MLVESVRGDSLSIHKLMHHIPISTAALVNELNSSLAARGQLALPYAEEHKYVVREQLLQLHEVSMQKMLGHIISTSKEEYAINNIKNILFTIFCEVIFNIFLTPVSILQRHPSLLPSRCEFTHNDGTAYMCLP